MSIVQPAKRFQYVPGFLARRFPIVAELDDNPVYLREMGLRYVRRRWIWARRGRELAYGSLLFIAAVLLAVTCLPALLLLLLVQRRFYSGRVRSMSDLPKHLDHEWQQGRLPQLCLTPMSGREILWGYAGAVLVRALRTWPLVTAAILILATGFILYFGLLPGYQDVPRIYLPPTAAIVLVLGAQFAIYKVISEILTMRASVEQVGLAAISTFLPSLPGLIRTAHTILVAMLSLLPGIAVGLVPLAAARPFASAPADPGRHYSNLVTIFFCLYGAVNLPLSWLCARWIFRTTFSRSSEAFQRAVVRLSGKEARRARSKIFGEK
jgi:hypothetical protein